MVIVCPIFMFKTVPMMELTLLTHIWYYKKTIKSLSEENTLMYGEVLLIDRKNNSFCI